ncbi:MAG: endonuclease/exonuclease/phosphatase family protein [Vicingaceae bacterium]|nr:endonuclease/exonuclease/phosphatase family protein [Vicingaceae bacterium]
MKLITTLLFTLFFISVKANDISILTYNVNYKLINKKIIPVLDSINADIVCLQESNKKWEEIIRNGLEYKYAHMKYRNSNASGGLAVLSKYPILDVKYIRNRPGWFPAALITIKKDQDTLQILNVHLKPPLSDNGWIGWKASFKADIVHVEELKQFMKYVDPNLPTLILGDFNEGDKKKALKWLKDENNFTDALPLFDKRTKTWRFILLRGRYDHLTFNNKLTCKFARVYKEGRSDHFPVYGEFKIN